MSYASEFYSGYGSIFDETCAIADAFDDVASAFVPAVSDDWQPGGILFLGSATYGWKFDGDTNDLRRSAEASVNLMHDYPKRSRFWQLAYGLKHRLGNAPLVWSNLHKIGSIGHEPRNELRCAQQQVASKSYRYEVETLKPGLIVFAVGDLVSDTLPTCLNEPDWDAWKFDTDKTIMWRPDLEIPTIWMTRSRSGKIQDRLDAAMERLNGLPTFELSKFQSLEI